jgi:hypothetical protein
MMHYSFMTRTVAVCLALTAGAALAVGVSAYAAGGTTSATATTGPPEKAATVTDTVTQPPKTVTQPAATVTQSTTVTPTVTTTTQTTPAGAAAATGVAVGAAANKDEADSEDGGLPAWAWVLIGAGVIAAASGAFLAGHSKGAGEARAGYGSPPGGSPREPPMPPPSA